MVEAVVGIVDAEAEASIPVSGLADGANVDDAFLARRNFTVVGGVFFFGGDHHGDMGVSDEAEGRVEVLPLGGLYGVVVDIGPFFGLPGIGVGGEEVFEFKFIGKGAEEVEIFAFGFFPVPFDGDFGFWIEVFGGVFFD